METLCAALHSSTFGRCLPGRPIEEHLAADRRAACGRIVAAALRAVQVRKAATQPEPSVRSVAPPTADMAWGSSRDPQPLDPPLEDDAVRSYQRAKAAEALALKRTLEAAHAGVKPDLTIETSNHDSTGHSFDISIEFLWTSGGGCTIVERLRGVPIPLESALALFHEIDLIEMEKVHFPLLPKIERFRVPHRFAANDFLMRSCVQPWADSVHNLQLFALPQRGEVMVWIQSPPEGATEFRGVALPPPGPRRKRNIIHGATMVFRPTPGSEDTHHDIDLFMKAKLPIPSWVIPGPLVRWAGATFARKVIGPVEALVASMGAEESPFRERAAADADGFYGGVRAQLRQLYLAVAQRGRAPERRTSAAPATAERPTWTFSILKPPSQEEAPWTVAIAPPAGTDLEGELLA
jgi:hypothetical protein